MDVQLGGGGDKVIVLACPELQGVRHWRERSEGDREESETFTRKYYSVKDCVVVFKYIFVVRVSLIMAPVRQYICGEIHQKFGT